MTSLGTKNAAAASRRDAVRVLVLRALGEADGPLSLSDLVGMLDPNVATDYLIKGQLDALAASGEVTSEVVQRTHNWTGGFARARWSTQASFKTRVYSLRKG